MKILQISDLHFGKHDGNLLDPLKRMAEELAPDIILATGDLADTPSDKLFSTAKDFLDELCVAAGNPGHPSKLIAIPGNHDASAWGIFKLMPRKRFWKHFAGATDHFDADSKVWIYGFDSATAAKFLDFSRGLIDDAAITAFHRKYDELEAAHGSKFREAFKVIALHHHPLPVNHQTDAKQPWLTINNAGALLCAALQKQVDLILHGHEHLQARAILQSTLGSKTPTHPIHVLSLGATLCKMEDGCNWFHLIEICPDGSVIAKPYFRKGQVFQTDPAESITLRSSRQVNEAKYQKSQEPGLRIASVRASCRIFAEGDSLRTIECRNAVSRDGTSLSSHAVAIPETDGYIDVGSIAAQSESPGFQGLHFAIPDSGSAVQQKVAGCVDFGGSKLGGSPPITFRYRWWALNAFAMDRIQFRRKYTDDDRTWREYCEHAVPQSESVAELVLSVRFPDGHAPRHLDVRVSGANGDRDGAAEQQLRLDGAIQYAESLSTAILCVPFPEPGCSYGVEWTVPEGGDKGPSPNPVLSDLQPAIFASSDPENFLADSFQQILDALVNAACHIDGVCKGEDGVPWDTGKLHATLMLFDEADSALRVVAAVPAEGSGMASSAFANIQFDFGVGICGRAFKTNEPRLYIRDLADSAEGPDYYFSGLVDDSQIAVLLSIPLRWQEDDRYPYGILNLSSPLHSCPLRNAKPLPISEYAKVAWKSVAAELAKLIA